MSFVVFGDSYVSRLQKFVKNHAFALNDSEVKFYGVPGMSTVRKFNDKFLMMLADKPRFVFLILGGNDINSNCNPQHIFDNLVAIVNRLKDAGVEHVFVASIVERGSFLTWTGCDSYMFNKVRRSINAKLGAKFKENYVDVGKKLRFPRHYDRDMIHPGEREGGMKVLRAAVYRCYRKTLKSILS